jgi:hypothetical protein
MDQRPTTLVRGVDWREVPYWKGECLGIGTKAEGLPVANRLKSDVWGTRECESGAV